MVLGRRLSRAGRQADLTNDVRKAAKHTDNTVGKTIFRPGYSVTSVSLLLWRLSSRSDSFLCSDCVSSALCVRFAFDHSIV